MVEIFLRFVFGVLQPDIQLSLIFSLGILFLMLGRISWAKKSMVLFLVLFFIYAMPWLPEYMTDRLENTYSTIHDYEINHIVNEFINSDTDNIYIIVLGAGHSTDPRLSPTSKLSRSVLMRLAEAVRLFKEFDNKILPVQLVTSASGFEGQMTQAAAVAEAAQVFGVPQNRISRLDTPTNTCEEARAFANAFGEGQIVLISTSAIHQRRALMLFEKTGSIPIAAPASFLNPKSPEAPNRWWRTYRPSMRNLNMLKRAIKEFVGYEVGIRTCHPLTRPEPS